MDLHIDQQSMRRHRRTKHITVQGQGKALELAPALHLPPPPHSLLHTLYTGFSGRKDFHISSAAKSQPLQTAPLTRPGPGSTAHPGNRVAH
eukprot:338455-Chlamydomonas_euryale.AAC.2